MFKYGMEIVHNHDNGYRDWLLYWNIFLRENESTPITSFNGKGFTLEVLFRSPFTEF